MTLGKVTLSRSKELPDKRFLFTDFDATPIGEVSPSGSTDETDVQGCACPCDDGEGCDFMLLFDRVGHFLFCPSCLQGWIE